LPYIEKDFPIEDINELAVREVNARKPVYLIHKWWARRPGPTFRAIILATFLEEDPMKLYYSRVNLREKLGYVPVIFDPFMGGGTTVVEAIRLGAKVVGADVNPVCWFITKKEIEPVDPKVFEEYANRLEKAVAERIKKYYKTTCPHGHEADIMYVFWTRVIRCENCKREVPLFKSFAIASIKDGYAVFCPNCNKVFNVDDISVPSECPNPSCKYVFTPENGFVEGEKYRCPHCGFASEILQAIRKEQKPPNLRMFAIEYYCETCEEKSRNKNLPEKERIRYEKTKRGYKQADDKDVELFEKAKNEFEHLKEHLQFPRQLIPAEGRSDPRPVNYGYKYYFQMFNERQLLCLSMLLEEILKIEDKNIREFMILTFSDSLNANNMFCKYNINRTELEPLFGHHVFWMPQTPVENNVWGTKYGRGSFKAYLEKTLKALKYVKKPYEIRVRNGRRERVYIPEEQISAKLVKHFTELNNSDDGVMLLTSTSENLREFIPDKSVDAVITDPPYYDNVMYSELSDFFYVWLRQGLKEEYPKEFGSPSVDSRREIVVNDAVGKGPEFYIDAMKRCLIECHRVLKDDGLLVMTFHHSSPEAWAAVLKFLVESGFIVIGAYPIHSETRSGVHPGIEYDSIIVCKKVEESRLPAKPLPKAAFEAEVRNRVEADADRFVEKHPRLSIEDLYVAVMGRAIQILSENYAVTLKTGRTFTLKDFAETLKDLGDIAFDVLLKKLFAKTPEVDRVSKIYAAIFAREKYVSFDTIDKVTKLGGVDFSLFEAENLIGEKKGSAAKIVEPEDRINWIERKLERGQPLLYIDSAQMLRLAWSKGKIKEAITKYVKNGIEKEKLENYIKFLAERTGDVEWARIAKALAETPVASLEKWLP
jgi:adenine-specific DNA methylase